MRSGTRAFRVARQSASECAATRALGLNGYRSLRHRLLVDWVLLARRKKRKNALHRRLIRSGMSAIGPKQTSLVALHMSAFGGKADIAIAANVKSRKYKERCSEYA